MATQKQCTDAGRQSHFFNGPFTDGDSAKIALCPLRKCRFFQSVVRFLIGLPLNRRRSSLSLFFPSFPPAPCFCCLLWYPLLRLILDNKYYITMRASEPAYPSFTFVLKTADYGYSDLRLPAYRASHLGRYHPYPRSRSHCRDHLMVRMPKTVPYSSKISLIRFEQQTVDYRYREGPLV